MPTVRELGIGFVPYSPLGRGFLTGRYRTLNDLPADDFRRFSPRFQGENFQKNLDLAKTIGELAKSRGCTPSQLALAWVLGQGEDVVPIPGTKKLNYLEENMAALGVVLTEAERAEIDALLPAGSASGDRYNEQAMRAIDQ